MGGCESNNEKEPAQLIDGCDRTEHRQLMCTRVQRIDSGQADQNLLPPDTNISKLLSFMPPFDTLSLLRGRLSELFVSKVNGMSATPFWLQVSWLDFWGSIVSMLPIRRSSFCLSWRQHPKQCQTSIFLAVCMNMKNGSDVFEFTFNVLGWNL